MEVWREKIAVVTGASSGIGEEIAKALVKNGMTVVGLARREERLKALEKSLSSEAGKFYSFKTDLRKEEEILRAFQWINDQLGGVHVLVNNAGFGFCELQEETSMEHFREIIEVNLIALHICTREALKSMKAHNINDGYIINISSITAQMSNPYPTTGTYYASKKAVNAISAALRAELSASNSKIRVTTIIPGLCDTEIFEKVNFPIPPSVLELALKPTDIADTLLFILQLKPHVLISELVIQPVADNVFRH